MKDQYLNDKKISSVQSPVLIGIGGKDTVVPMRFGKKLFEVANEPKTLKIYDQAEHMSLYNYGFGQDVLEFMKSLDQK